MRISVILFTLLVASFAHAQSYEQTLKKCIKNFHEGLGQFTKENANTEIERRYAVLNDCMRGQKFPDFILTTYNGSKYSSKDNANKVVLLNFWFTKSPTSVAIVPLLNELVDEYEGQNFVILSFAADGFAALSSFLKEHPVKYLIIEKSKDLINPQFSTLLGYPTNIILNKKGEVVEYRVGAGLDSADLAKTKADFKRIINDELAK